MKWSKRYFVVAQEFQGKRRLVKHPTKEAAEKHLAAKPRAVPHARADPDAAAGVDVALVPDEEELLKIELEVYRARFGFFTGVLLPILRSIPCAPLTAPAIARRR